MSVPKYHFKTEPLFKYQYEIFKRFNAYSFIFKNLDLKNLVSLKIIFTKISRNLFFRLKGFYQEKGISILHH